VDKPNSNNGLEAKYAAELREYESKKKAAKKNNTKAPHAPKQPTPYRQCHCLQLFCVTVGQTLGSSCPIECKDENGISFGVDQFGNCACYICKCNCSMAYTPEAPQILRTKETLDKDAIQKQKAIEQQKSVSALASLIGQASTNTLATAIASGKKFSNQTIQEMSMTAAAQSLATMFDPNDNAALLQTLRKEVGRPTTKVSMPVPINIAGKSTDVFDTRSLSNRKANFRQENNRLSVKNDGSASLLDPY
jgi:hypothetical protein